MTTPGSPSLPGGDQVVLRAHDPAWERRYETEARRLRDALAGIPCEIAHIGSTAIPELVAKPIVDIAVRIDSIDRIDAVRDRIERLGYAYQGEYGLPGRHFFTLGCPRTVHLHVVDDATDHWIRWRAFVRLLRQNPAVRARYAALKESLAEQHREDRPGYTAAKSGFIDELVDVFLRDEPGPDDEPDAGGEEKR